MPDQPTAHDAPTQDPALDELLSTIRLALPNLSEDVASALCRLALAVARPILAEEIAAACNWEAARAPVKYASGFTHGSGVVAGLLGAGQIARRHASNPPATSANESALNAAKFSGERHERERIAYQVERLLPDDATRVEVLRIVRDDRYALDQLVARRKTETTD